MLKLFWGYTLYFFLCVVDTISGHCILAVNTSTRIVQYFSSVLKFINALTLLPNNAHYSTPVIEDINSLLSEREFFKLFKPLSLSKYF